MAGPAAQSVAHLVEYSVHEFNHICEPRTVFAANWITAILIVMESLFVLRGHRSTSADDKAQSISAGRKTGIYFKMDAEKVLVIGGGTFELLAVQSSQQ